jgi:hypothetical protein
MFMQRFVFISFNEQVVLFSRRFTAKIPKCSCKKIFLLHSIQLSDNIRIFCAGEFRTITGLTSPREGLACTFDKSTGSLIVSGGGSYATNEVKHVERLDLR